MSVTEVVLDGVCGTGGSGCEENVVGSVGGEGGTVDAGLGSEASSGLPEESVKADADAMSGWDTAAEQSVVEVSKGVCPSRWFCVRIRRACGARPWFS